MELVELDTLRNALVGLPGSSGLSTEQRKRLTIAVELVANPSIIFMDEPTSGLDARAAAIVMRTVRNTVDTGRTVVCTIHQPSIEIFEAFDEVSKLEISCERDNIFILHSLNVLQILLYTMFLCVAATYETRWTSDIWGKAWTAVTNYDKLLSGMHLFPLVPFLFTCCREEGRTYKIY